MLDFKRPGVYLIEEPSPVADEFRTGIPAFLGYAGSHSALEVNIPHQLIWRTQVDQFALTGYLASAVRGFFDNGGLICYVVRLLDSGERVDALRQGLEALAPLDRVDLICAPDIMRPHLENGEEPTVDEIVDEIAPLQMALLEHCDSVGDRFAILDSLHIKVAQIAGVKQQRETLRGTNGALYFPWLKVRAEQETYLFSLDTTLLAGEPADLAADQLPDLRPHFDNHGKPLSDAATFSPRQAGSRWLIVDQLAIGGTSYEIRYELMPVIENGVPVERNMLNVYQGPSANGYTETVPPCGHIAGIYARSDRQTGVHKTPANETIENVFDLEVVVTNAEQDDLNPLAINCLRAFPGRGIRVWGGRTLSSDAAWTYIGTRRLFLTAGRWIERNLASMAFEPNEPRLWVRIARELTAYFTDLFRRGALKGQSPAQAFFVKCDAETNPVSVRDSGQVITEIGLAPVAPSEYLVVRIVLSAGGTTILEPARPT